METLLHKSKVATLWNVLFYLICGFAKPWLTFILVLGSGLNSVWISWKRHCCWVFQIYFLQHKLPSLRQTGGKAYISSAGISKTPQTHTKRIQLHKWVHRWEEDCVFFNTVMTPLISGQKHSDGGTVFITITFISAVNPNAIKDDHSICLAKVRPGAVDYNLLMTAAWERGNFYNPWGEFW